MSSESWPEPARRLLDRAAARHGGWDRWERLDEVRLRVVSLGGFIPRAKGIGRTFPMVGQAVVRPRAWEVRFVDYPAVGIDGIFARGDVRLIERGGRVASESIGHRASFRGLGKWRRWRPLDAIYFFGYALATYMALPFVLARTRLVGHDARRRSLTVHFPDELESHSRRQRFVFAEDGLLVRHDYRAEILAAEPLCRRGRDAVRDRAPRDHAARWAGAAHPGPRGGSVGVRGQRPRLTAPAAAPQTP